MRKIGIPFLLLLVLNGGCRKDRNTYVITGHAYDQFTLVPIVHTKVEVTENYDQGHTDATTLGETTTDHNGDYSFTSSNFQKGFKSLVVSVLGTDGTVGHEGTTDLQPTMTVDVPCATHSQIYYTFINTTPFDQNDQLSNMYIDRPFGQQWVFPSTQVFTGISVNETTWTSFYGYTTTIMHYTVTKNSITQHLADTIVTPNNMQSIAIRDTIRY